MRHLLPVFLLLVLFSAVLWPQSVADSTALSQLSDLIARDQYTAAATSIAAVRDPAVRAAHWRHFGIEAVDRADIRVESGDFPQAAAILDSALFHLARAGRADSLPTAGLWTWKAFTYRKMEQYADLLDAYNEAIRIYEFHQAQGNSVAYCYKNVAQGYMRRQDYVRADKYLKAAIRSDTAGQYLLSVYGQLANNAYWQDSLDLALHYFEIGKNYSGSANSLAALRSAAANAFIKKDQWREAEVLMLQALDFYSSQTKEGDNCIRSLTSLATIAEYTGRTRAAERHYRAAEQVGLDFFKKNKSREMAKLYCEWGDFLLRQNRETDALWACQKALVQAYPQFDNPDPAANPSPEAAPVEAWAMYAPARKAALLLRHPQPEARAAAAACFDLAFAAAERLRRTYGTDDSKLYFAQHNYDLRQAAASNLWAMYQSSGDDQHLKRLFDLLESGRANTLRDALQQQRALALAGIPDALLELEEALRREIALTQSKLAESDTEALPRLQDALFKLEHRYEDLLARLSKNYAQFREYSQAGQTADVAAIQSALPDQTTLLSYFDAGDRYLCLMLRHSGLSAWEIPRDAALDETLARFLLLLTDKQRQETNPEAYFADAYALRQRLLPDSALAGAGTLVLVPDGQLVHLPFEALLTAPYSGGYSQAPYLLRTCAVQYAWSAALLADAPARRQQSKSLLYAAPFAVSARDGLAILPNSLREKPEGTSLLLLQGSAATADNFVQMAAQHNVLHLATHAHAAQHTQPGIEFFDRTLPFPEIYAQRLNASLVALSACETNVGQFVQGEGLLSLARAFAYAGAHSLVASHWSVNDRSTALLFAAFYKHLKSGLPKSEALRQAKLDLLAESGPEARKTPYHWAAFTLSGQDGPVVLHGSGWSWWWALVASVVVGLLGLLWRRFRATST